MMQELLSVYVPRHPRVNPENPAQAMQGPVAHRARSSLAAWDRIHREVPCMLVKRLNTKAEG
jgi:hypothetical protein